MSSSPQTMERVAPVTAATQVETGAHAWYGHVLWVAAAAGLGFAMTALFSGVLELSRDWFVVAYLGIIAPFLYGYVRWSGISVGEHLRRHLALGLVGAVIVGGVMVMAVQNMDASPRATGVDLAWNILWLGIIYGIVDALLLNVLPVMGVWRASSLLGRTATWAGKIVTGTMGLAASLGVTAAYHLGYVEFRGSEVADPLFGNAIMTLGYIVFANPVTAVGAHVALHVASVFHGIDTTVTLPPHY